MLIYKQMKSRLSCDLSLTDPEGWYGEVLGTGTQKWEGVQDGEHVYTRGGFMLMYGKTITMF